MVTAEPRGLGALRKRGVFEPLATPAVIAAISELLGHDGWPRPYSWGDPLVTFPTQGPWNAVFTAHPWLRGIREPGPPAERIARLMAGGAHVDGVDVRAVELTGAPGDVVFLHPHLFHAPAPNRSAAPRVMVTGGLAMET